MIVQAVVEVVVEVAVIVYAVVEVVAKVNQKTKNVAVVKYVHAAAAIVVMIHAKMEDALKEDVV